MIIENCLQGSAEWHRMRCGVVTASELAKIITPGKMDLSKQRDSYMHKCLAEWYTGEPVDDFAGNAATERGHFYEADAADLFTLLTEVEPKAVGFVFRDESRTTGCSPDWMARDETSGMECKCPLAHTHIGWLLDDAVPMKHVPQIQFSLWVTQLPRWHFLSYFPGMPPLLKEVFPDERWQDALDEHIPVFVDEMMAARARLIELGVKR